MVGGYETVAPHIDDGAADFGDTGFVTGEVVVGGCTQCHDDFGADQLHLLFEIGEAGVSLFGCGDTIVGGTAFDDVGDVDGASGNLQDIFDHFGQKFAGPADEGASGGILLGAGPFADKHQEGVGISFAEDRFVAALAQIAELALGYDLLQRS